MCMHIYTHPCMCVHTHLYSRLMRPSKVTFAVLTKADGIWYFSQLQ